MAQDWRTPDVEALFGAIRRLDTPDETERFFRDLCTLNELHDLGQRWAVVRLLDSGLHYAEISKRTGASTATITRIASWLNHGEDGYRRALARLKDADGAMPSPAGPARSGTGR